MFSGRKWQVLWGKEEQRRGYRALEAQTRRREVAVYKRVVTTGER